MCHAVQMEAVPHAAEVLQSFRDTSPRLLDAAHDRHGRGVVAPPAVAVRHLVEAIARGDRADLNRFEQNVVSRVSCHNDVSYGSAAILFDPGVQVHSDASRCASATRGPLLE